MTNDKCCGDCKDNCCGNPYKKHMCVLLIIMLAFLVLALGEYKIYRSQTALNKMISEGFMDLKEQNKTKVMQEPKDVETTQKASPSGAKVIVE